MLLTVFALTPILLAASTTATAIPVDTLPTPQSRTDSRCADMVVHYARGTFEARPIGGVIGQSFNTTLAQALGAESKTLAFTGVDYSASILGFLVGGDTGGSATLADSVIATASTCPDAKIVMAGYSQGAQLVHIAADKLPESVQQRVVAVVTFGDPKQKSSLPLILEARRKTFCNAGDLICRGTILITSAHINYAKDAPAAAAFVTARL